MARLAFKMRGLNMGEGIVTIGMALLICVPIIIGLKDGASSGGMAFFAILLLILLGVGALQIAN